MKPDPSQPPEAKPVQGTSAVAADGTADPATGIAANVAGNGSPDVRADTEPDLSGPPDADNVYFDIFQTLPDAAGTTRLSDGRYVAVNPAFERIFGYTRQEALGCTATELGIWPDEAERIKLRKILVDKREVDRLELQARAKGGRLMRGQMSGRVTLIKGEPSLVWVFRDLSQEIKVAELLAYNRAALDAAGRMGRFGAWTQYLKGTQPNYWSPMCREILGVSPDAPTASDFAGDHVVPEHQALVRHSEQQGRLDLVRWDIEIQIVRPSGQRVWVRMAGEPVAEQGQYGYTRGLIQDIDASRAAQAQSQEREEQLLLSVAAANLGTWNLNMVTREGTGNARWRELRGVTQPQESIPLQALLAATHPDDIAAVQSAFREQFAQNSPMMEFVTRVTWPDQSQHWVRDLGKVVARDESGRALRMLGMTMDVTEHYEQQERLQHLAHYDGLTGLPNRILLGDRMRQAMAHADRTGDLLGVVFLDLDGFKPVNDTLGHSAGDELLQKIATRLPQAMRAEDSVARMGGDEFVLLLPGLANNRDCELALHRAMAAIAEPVTIGGHVVAVTASMGATLYPLDQSDSDTLLRHADQAMYSAKQKGRNCFHFFDAGQEEAARMRTGRLAELRAAIVGGEFVLHLQPRVNMRSGQVLGAEALARWQHPTLGLLSPLHFLPEIEGSELNIAFGEWVIDSALVQLQDWQEQGLRLALSINITARHLQKKGFFEHLRQRIADYPLVAPERLEIEVTESGSLSDLDAAVQVIEQLHDFGIQVSLDDFGTGYSSLTYLRRLPVDTLKIDQSFVRDMLADLDDRAIVKGVIGLADSFGLKVVAEGVETVQQGDLLLDMGCDMAQGYGIARPMPAAQLPGWALGWQLQSLWV